MTKYENKTIQKTTLVAEDCYFINCVLKDCDVFYSGGDFELANVTFEDCRWHFRGSALKTVQLQQTIGMLKPNMTVVPPTQNLAKAN